MHMPLRPFFACPSGNMSQRETHSFVSLCLPKTNTGAEKTEIRKSFQEMIKIDNSRFFSRHKKRATAVDHDLQ